MHITDFVKGFKNYPVLFIGTGLSLRYLEKSYSWDSLLAKIASEIEPNEEFYIDIKSDVNNNGTDDFPAIGSILTKMFNVLLKNDRNGKFKNINDQYYKYYQSKTHSKITRLQIYISELLKNPSLRESSQHEIEELKKAEKNIISVITTNYDQLVENIFNFHPLVGNDILLSNPYGAIYKIHGCVSHPEKIIITSEDYEQFEENYELIRAQLISLFIHNPIIFLGYSISDKNIIDVLRTIFKYVDSDSEIAEQIRKNFLIVEYEKNSTNTEVNDFDINLGNNQIIRINKIKTDKFSAIYQALSNLSLPVPAMDIRRIRDIARIITEEPNNLQVSISDDINNLNNSDRVLYIGTKFISINIQDLIDAYFEIIENKDQSRLKALEKIKVRSNEYFPFFGFSKISSVANSSDLKNKQVSKLEEYFAKSQKDKLEYSYTTPQSVMDDFTISKSYVNKILTISTLNGAMNLDALEKYLREESLQHSHNTDFRRLLCAYDLMRYGNFDTTKFKKNEDSGNKN